MIKRVVLFVLLGFIAMSCNKAAVVLKPVEEQEFSYKDLLVSKVSEEDFVFCLDSLTTDTDYYDLQDKFCRTKNKKQAFVHLSSYGRFVPITFLKDCDNDYVFCTRGINHLEMVVSNQKEWLIDGNYYEIVRQKKLNVLVNSYYAELIKEEERRKVKSDYFKKMVALKLDVRMVESNGLKDSLYICLLKSHTEFLKAKKKETQKSFTELREDFPLRITIGDHNIVILDTPEYVK